MNDTVIRLDNVSKFYKLYESPKVRLKEALHPFGKKYHKEFYAINKIDLQVGRGEVLGIVGRNGSGKSTLLKLIANVIVPSSGRVSVVGNINALLELGSGLNPEFTGLQNIYFMGSINGYSREEMEGKVEEIVAFSELGEFIHQPLKSYSSGMKSRLAFGIATTITPEILILDEVLSVGDALFRRKSFARMEQLIAENRTVLFVSHNEQSVKSICTKAILLDQGRLIYQGKPDETVNYYLELLYAKDRNSVIEHKILKKTPAPQPQKDDPPEEQIIKTKSRQYVKVHNADIETVNIVNVGDENTVTVLVQNEEYKVRCVIRVNDAYDNLSLAVAVKNEQGVVITGVSPRLAGKTIRNNEKSRHITFEYKFICKFNPSSYFIDVSLMGDVEGKNEILCYIIDAISIKVTSNNKDASMNFGFVKLLEPVSNIL